MVNAERYAPKPWRLRLYRDDRALWVGVGDGDPRTALPVEERLRRPAIPRWSEKRGRGLFLARTACRGECWVRSTSTRASVTGGKEILLRFARDSVSAPAVQLWSDRPRVPKVRADERVPDATAYRGPSRWSRPTRGERFLPPGTPEFLFTH